MLMDSGRMERDNAIVDRRNYPGPGVRPAMLTQRAVREVGNADGGGEVNSPQLC
jgi:hypothetical protein